MTDPPPPLPQSPSRGGDGRPPGSTPPRRRWLNDAQTAWVTAVAAAGGAAFLVGLRTAPARAWANLLLSDFFFLSLSLAAAVFIAMHYVASARWPTVLRRVPEAMTAYLPVGALGMGLLLMGARELYPWALPAAAARDPLLAGKAAFLNLPGFAARMALYCGVWIALARGLVANSRRQDEAGDREFSRRNAALSAGFLVAFAATYSLASIDWLMSLEPHWYSTIYPWYVFAGALAYGVAGLTLLVILLRRRGILPDVRAPHLHDLGKYMFAFSVFWAYLWFSQYLLIWYSNIPEETAYYEARLADGWTVPFWLNPVLNFLVPFFLLLTAGHKKDERWLLAAAVVLIAGHWLDAYLLVMPSVLEAGPRAGWLEAGVFAGLGALFVLLFDRSFGAAAPTPIGDPTLRESMHHHG